MLLRLQCAGRPALGAGVLRANAARGIASLAAIAGPRTRRVEAPQATPARCCCVARRPVAAAWWPAPGARTRGFASAASTPTTAASPAATPNRPPYRLVFFASSDFSIPALAALHQHAGELLHDGRCTVVTPADKPTGRGQVIVPSAFKLAALQYKFDVVQLPIDINFRMAGWSLPQSLQGQVDVGVVVSFGYMLPASLISAFPHGVINIHPSVLPRYRGSSPIQFALAQGDRETGVSIIDVHPEHIDGGNIIDQSRRAVPRDATFENLAPVLAKQGADQLIDVLRHLADKQRASQQQDLTPIASSSVVDSRASAPRIPKSAGELLFGVHAPEVLWRVYAACKGFTPVFTHFMGNRITIVDAMHPAEATSKLAAATAEGASTAADSSSRYPTLADASARGVGSVFFDARLAAIGIICASHTRDTPAVFYITSVHLAGKKSPVSASTFAAGYLDARKKNKKTTDDEKAMGWKFTTAGTHADATDSSAPVVDWWAGRLTTPEREDLLVAR